MRTLEETWASFRVCLTAFKRVVQCTLGNQFLWIKKNDHIIFIKCSQKWKKKSFYALYHSFMFSSVKKGKLVRPNISPTWNRKFCPFFEINIPLELDPSLELFFSFKSAPVSIVLELENLEHKNHSCCLPNLQQILPYTFSCYWVSFFWKNWAVNKLWYTIF